MNEMLLDISGTDDFGAPNGAFAIQIDDLKTKKTVISADLKEATTYFFGSDGCVVADIYIPTYNNQDWVSACKITKEWIENPNKSDKDKMYSFIAADLNSEDHEVFIFTDPVFLNCFTTPTALRMIISFNNLNTLLFMPELNEYTQFDEMILNKEKEEEEEINNEILLLEEEEKSINSLNPVEEMIKNNYSKFSDSKQDTVVLNEENKGIRFTDEEGEI